MKNLSETVIGRETFVRGKIMNFENWKVTLPDGSEATREIVTLRGASAVVALDGENNIYLVRQGRAAIESVTLQLPAGKLDSSSEDSLICAKRELTEETGLNAEKWEKLLTIHPSPAISNEAIHLYLASGLYCGLAHPDEGEFINVEKIPLRKAVEMVLTGRISDSKTIIGIMFAEHTSCTNI